MSWIEIIADRKIRDAQEEGAFDNLPGKGQPLNLEYDPRIPPELRVAYRIMKDANMLPDWIQLDKDVRQRQERWDAQVSAYTARRAEELASRPSRGSKGFDEDLDRTRDRFLYRATEGLCELNRMIDRLNLIVPAPSRQRLRIDIPARIEALETEFPRLTRSAAGAFGSWRSLLQEERKPTRLGNRMPLRRKRGAIG
jgi:hypothetical protein